MESEDKGEQIVLKATTFKEEPCNNCIYLCKFITENDPSSFQIHVQSKYA